MFFLLVFRFHPVVSRNYSAGIYHSADYVILLEGLRTIKT